MPAGAEASPLRPGHRRHLLIYDGSCGFCRSAVAWALERDRGDRIRALPFQDPRALRETGVPEARTRREVVLVAPAGGRRGGAEAVAGVLRLLPGWETAGRLLELPLVRTVADVVYRWIARRRRCVTGLTDGSARAAGDRVPGDGEP